MNPTREQAITPEELRELFMSLIPTQQALFTRAVNAAHQSGLELGAAAARAQALDEALSACDGERLHDDTGHPTDIGYMQAIGDCKTAIQALKGKQ